MKVVVGVFFGGKSVEHEVSIISALQVMSAIDKEKYEVVPIYITKDNHFYTSDRLKEVQIYKDIENLKKQCMEINFLNKGSRMVIYKADSIIRKEISYIDVAFPVVHGLNVEDGTLQGFLEMYNIPYVGCDVCASAVGMNKIIFKKVLEASNIPVIDYCEVYTADFEKDNKGTLEEVKKKLNFPMIIKPANLGSSVGIKVVKNESEFIDSMNYVFEFTDEVLIEKLVVNLREINSAVLGNRDEVEVSVLEEPLRKDEILSFKDKYMSEGGKNSKQSSGMASLTRKIPADLTKDQEDKVYNLSKEVFKLLGCEGVARIDYILDGDTNEIYVNEINTIPGSISFYLWEPKDIKFNILCDKLIKLAIKRQDKRSKKIYSNDVNILNMSPKK